MFTCALALALGCSPPADAGDSSVEIGAGGLSFAANPSIRIEQQDVLVAPDKISITYTIHNEATTPQAIYVSFLLPDLDANAIAEGELALASTDPANFVQFTVTADGQPVAMRTEHRVTALGLEVLALLAAAELPLFPFADMLAAKLEALMPAQRIELLERGVIKEDGTAIAPAWNFKTIAYWRQSFAPDQTITIRHAYRPIASTTTLPPEAIAALRKRSCLSAAQEAAIAKLPTGDGNGPTLTSLTYSATPAADALGAIRRFRLIVETGDPLTVVATCREHLHQTGPIQLEWSVTDYLPDEDFQFAFAR